MRLETLIMAQLGKMDSHSLLGYYRVKRMLDCPMNVMQTQINRAIGSAINDKVLPEIEIIKAICLWIKSALGRVRTQMSEVSIMFGKTGKRDLQRQTQSPHLILWKTRTLHLTVTFFEKN